MLTHAGPEAPVEVQYFPCARGQLTASQVPVQTTSHAHAPEQVTLSQALSPLHAIMHRPSVQVIDPQEFVPMQVIEHSPLQWMLPHEPGVGHVMSQCVSGGQLNEPPPVPAGTMQDGGDVPGSQLAHPIGQFASSMQ